VQDIVARGEWILPHRNGELPSKPPLFHWLAAPLGRVFGVSDATLRLPSALAAAVMAGTTFALGCGARGADGRLARARRAPRDGRFLAVGERSARRHGVRGVLHAVARRLPRLVRAGRRRAAAGRALCYLGAACAVLAKGPPASSFPRLVIGVFLLWQRDLDAIARLWSWPLAAAVALLDGGWYALAIRAGGADFVAVQLLYENVDRFLGGIASRTSPGNGASATSRYACRSSSRATSCPGTWRSFGGCAASARTRPAASCTRGGSRCSHSSPSRSASARSTSCRSRRRSRSSRGARSPRWRRAAGGWGRRRDGDRRARRRILAAAQVTRAYHSRRDSLLDVARDVGRIVPPDAELYASPALEPPAVLVLSYRLARPIRRLPRDCIAGVFVLAPPNDRRMPGATRALVSSTRGHTPVALYRRRCT
jgi:hypothetical protein